MLLTNEVISAIEAAASDAGSMVELARQCGINNSTLGKYCRGVIREISDRRWGRLYPRIRRFMPEGPHSLAPGKAAGAYYFPEYLANAATFLGLAQQWESLEEIPDGMPPRELASRRGGLFRICDDSMAPLIRERDVIAVDWTAPVESGNIVVAKAGQRVLVRRYRRDSFAIVLDCLNPAWPEMVVQEPSWKYRVVGVLRVL